MVAKRMLARMLAAALVALALVPMLATAAYAWGFEVDEMEYTINEDDATVTVSKASESISGAVAIPASVEHDEKSYTVTAIGREAFKDCESLGSVGIPASVTSIGDHAFKRCTSLLSVTFEGESQLETIDNRAFDTCSSLESIDIPATVREIGQGAFASTGLKDVTLPEGLETISYALFHGCGSLTQVAIPSTVTYIGDFAFDGCGKLSTIHYGGSRLQWEAIGWGIGNPDIEPGSISFGKFDVMFDSRGGGEVAPQVVAPGGKAAEPQDPTKDGMVFDGWYSDEDPASPFDFSNTAIDGDLALHAVYHCAGHQWVQKVQKATPTADGRVYQKCSVCGAEETIAPLPKVGTIKLAKASFTYTGKAIQPKVTVANASEALSTDCYTVSYSNNVNAGTATAKKLFKVSKAKGKVAYKKAKGSKKITVAKDGKVSVKKGCKAGTYALTVKVRAAGDANYKASKWKAVKVKVLVK